MAKTCVCISLYLRILGLFSTEQLCPFKSLPHADMAFLDAVCRIWDTSGEDESKNEATIPIGFGAGSYGMFGMELV